MMYDDFWNDAPPPPSPLLPPQTVPNGVLCFFSSYKMLNKLTERWKVGGAGGRGLGRRL